MKIKQLLELKYAQYCSLDFIELDPISIPHQFSKKQDIEIAGFITAIISWGNRKSIITSANRILDIMDRDPYEFILHHTSADLETMKGFVHRTFNETDLLYFFTRLQNHYQEYDSLEDAFLPQNFSDLTISLSHFYHTFFKLDHLTRTRKHIATPEKNSACKRLCMYLRWMVRQGPVDFHLWNRIQPSHLVCPLDIHVLHTAYRLGLIETLKADWKQALSLTEKLKIYDPVDPCKYDYALFGIGVMEGKS
jgi:uncharacterized protein (TIGR02757 family)